MERVDFLFKNGHTRVMARRQAEIISKLGHGTYMTRDMKAGEVELPAQEEESKPIVMSVADDLDSEGNAWNADIHVSTRLKNQNGTWRKKPGAAA